MTRLLGLMGAQPYVLESKLFNPQEALELGLVHELVPGDAALRPAALAWIAANPTAQHPWETKGYKVPGGLPSNPAVAQMLPVAPAMIKKQTRGLYPAPEAIMACMVEGAMVDMDTALRIESRKLAGLLTSASKRADFAQSVAVVARELASGTANFYLAALVSDGKGFRAAPALPLIVLPAG